MGAITDRLVIGLQDVKSWLKIPLEYSGVVTVVVLSVVEDQVFNLLVADKSYSVTAGVGATPDSIAADLVVAVTGDPPTGVTPAAVGTGGKYTLTIASANAPVEIFVSAGQDVEPQFNRDDQLLNSMLTVAITMADEYCNNPFQDDDGVDQDIPEPVKVGVLQIVDWLYLDYTTSSASASGSTAPTGPVKSKKAGDLSITYATPGEMRAALGARGMSDLPGFVQNILAMYRLMPGWSAAREPREKPPGLANQLLSTEDFE